MPPPYVYILHKEEFSGQYPPEFNDKITRVEFYESMNKLHNAVNSDKAPKYVVLLLLVGAMFVVLSVVLCGIFFSLKSQPLRIAAIALAPIATLVFCGMFCYNITKETQVEKTIKKTVADLNKRFNSDHRIGWKYFKTETRSGKIKTTHRNIEILLDFKREELDVLSKENEKSPLIPIGKSNTLRKEFHESKN